MMEVVWQKRFDAIDCRIETLEATLDSSTPAFCRKETLRQLVQCFREFSRAQFGWFCRGFSNGTLNHFPALPPENALTITLEQISYDLEALQWAVEQRRHATLDPDPNLAWALETADKLGDAALEPARALFDLEGVTVVTCFQKFTEIRMIPYARVALIGLPITCIPCDKEGQRQLVARDFLAVPHEVAHYVYWHGKVGQEPLRRYIANRIAPQMEAGSEWLEEIFADLYGCLVAGPPIAQSFQDLQMRVSQERFLSDSGKHPTPLLRPELYQRVLARAFGKAGRRWAPVLAGRWDRLRDSRAGHRSANRRIRHAGKLRKPGRVRKGLKVAVRELLTLCPTGHFAGQWWRQATDWSVSADPADGTLYEQFAERLESADLPTPPDEVECVPYSRLQNEWQAQQTIPSWLHVLQAGGWATKGPETNPVGG
jgi:hypothetical protein